MRLIFALPLILLLPRAAEAGCLTCTTDVICHENFDESYVCAFDPNWEGYCCVRGADAGMTGHDAGLTDDAGIADGSSPSCETQSCVSADGCAELGSDWSCEMRSGCCVYNPPSCETFCRDSASECAELGAGWTCVDACCIYAPDTCDNPCESITGCSELGSAWVCDTAAGCCVDLLAPDAGAGMDGGGGDAAQGEARADASGPATNRPVRIVTQDRRRGCRCSGHADGNGAPLALLLLLFPFFRSGLSGGPRSRPVSNMIR